MAKPEWFDKEVGARVGVSFRHQQTAGTITDVGRVLVGVRIDGPLSAEGAVAGSVVWRYFHEIYDIEEET